MISIIDTGKLERLSQACTCCEGNFEADPNGELVNYADLQTNVDLEAFAEKLWNKFCDTRYANHTPVKTIFHTALREILK